MAVTVNCNDKATRKFWIELIQLYKEQPCLWDPCCPEYNSDMHRQLAYNILLEKYWEVDGTGTLKDLKGRIMTFRKGFGREYNKVLNNISYVPKLWYFQLLKFTKPQMESVSDERPNQQLDWGTDSQSPFPDKARKDNELLQYLSDSNPETSTVSPILQPPQPTYQGLPIISTVSSLAENENPSISRDSPNTQTYQGLPIISTVSSLAEDETSSSSQSSSYTPTYHGLPILSTVSSLAEEENPSTSKGLDSNQSYQGLLTLAGKENPSTFECRSRVKLEEAEHRFEDTEDDSSAFAALVKAKMRRFDPVQRMIAQKLIMDIMVMADTKQLQLSSSILNPTSVSQDISNGGTEASRSNSQYLIDSDDDDDDCPLAKRQKYHD